MFWPLFYIFFFFVSQAFSTSLNAKPGCPDHCGDLLVPYPFGVGSDCSLNPHFNINCNTSKAYLSIIDKQVVEINETYIRVKYPNLAAVCYEGGNATYRDHVRVNLSGTPYTLSHKNRLTAIGCDDAVVQSDSNGGCLAFCGEEYEIGYCPVNATSPGNGCCHATINKDTGTVGAELFDMSRKLRARKLFQCSYAFIQELEPGKEKAFSYPLYYLHNSTVLQNDNWASTTSPPVVLLDWLIGTKNCSTARLNSDAYACRDDKSVCVDVDAPGYQCSCQEGYSGNPYLPGGCKSKVLLSSIAKERCPDRCGELPIPFPFGVGPNCYLEPSFDITCNTSTNPRKAYLSILKAEVIRFESSRVWVNYPNLGFSCYNWSDTERIVTMSEHRSLIIDFSKTQFTLTNDSWITVIGCDDVVVGITRHANRTSNLNSCAAFCQSSEISECPHAYDPGNGCCRAPILGGTSYLEANLSEFIGLWPRMNFSCSIVFVGHKDQSTTSYGIFNNPSQISPYHLKRNRHNSIFPLNWRVGSLNCKQAQSDPTAFACKNNTDCVDFDATIGGYLCNCSKGYQGDPYLAPGCQDIDECADNTTNPCDSNSSCINTLGSFHCSCPKGYYGDGRKDGRGCFQLPPSKTKTIILIGMGSGLGFLLLISMSFRLYKMLKNRREKIVKEKFFKRNGGLLLQKQTNEGTLGKTKVFPSKELEVATDHFNENRILGRGGQGTVYKGMLSDGMIVAIKKSKLVEENQLNQFINEVAILSQINHRNVVRLLGCCLETEVPMLVYEFLPNGTLFDFIHDLNNEIPFPWTMRIKIAADIAGSLAYLHSASFVPIYHRDIKSSNLLLDEKYVIKLADFGMSRSVASNKTHLTTMVKGTFGYLDPEYFQSSQFTEKSDVYSFGVVLLELLSGQRPISSDETYEERGLAARFLTCMDENCLDTILDPKVCEEDRKEEMILVARLAQKCLNFKGKMRPTMKEVATELESLRMSQKSIANDQALDVRDFEDMHTTVSDNEYTWTGSYKSIIVESTSGTDTSPVMSDQRDHDDEH